MAGESSGVFCVCVDSVESKWRARNATTHALYKEVSSIMYKLSYAYSEDDSNQSVHLHGLIRV